jgi:hypothetical protein
MASCAGARFEVAAFEPLDDLIDATAPAAALPIAWAGGMAGHCWVSE